jgi:uncharacterized protein (TIGR03067 family)
MMANPKGIITCAMAVFSIFGIHSAFAQDATNEVRGSWEITEVVFHGHSWEQRVNGTKFIFDDEQLTIDSSNVSQPLYKGQTIAVSLTDNGGIGEITTTNCDGKFVGRTARGIYEIKGDTLRICMPTSQDAPRPTSFDSSEATQCALYVLKRAS